MSPTMESLTRYKFLLYFTEPILFTARPSLKILKNWVLTEKSNPYPFPTDFGIDPVSVKLEGFEFATEITGGRVPKEYIPSVEKGVNKALDEGSLAGFPLVDLKAVLYDGSYHDVDSSGMSFEIASIQALKQGLGDAGPVLLEPVVKLSINVPDAYTGEVISDINGKRGRILGMNPDDGATLIEAEVPLAEVQRYAQDLRSVSQGRGTYSLEFDHYDQVPANLEPKVIEDAKRAKEEETV